jgi:hypothetical protein
VRRSTSVARSSASFSAAAKHSQRSAPPHRFHSSGRLTGSDVGSQDTPMAAHAANSSSAGGGHSSINAGRRSISLGAVWSVLGGSLGLGGSGSVSGTGSGGSRIFGRLRWSTEDTSRHGNSLLGRSSPDDSHHHQHHHQQHHQQPQQQYDSSRASQAKGSGAISFVVHGPSGTAALLPPSRSLPSRMSATAAATATAAAAAVSGLGPASDGGASFGLAPSSAPNRRSVSLGRELSANTAAAAAKATSLAAAAAAEGGVQRSAASHSEAAGPHVMHRLGRLHQEADGTGNTDDGSARPHAKPLGEGTEGRSEASGSQQPAAEPWESPLMILQDSDARLAFSKMQPERFPSVHGLAPEVADPCNWYDSGDGPRGAGYSEGMLPALMCYGVCICLA